MKLIGRGKVNSQDIQRLYGMTKTEGWGTFTKWLESYYYEIADEVLADGADVQSARGAAHVVQALMVSFEKDVCALFENMRKELDKMPEKA